MERKVFFSTFHPDAALLLRQHQSIYPVSFSETSFHFSTALAYADLNFDLDLHCTFGPNESLVWPSEICIYLQEISIQGFFMHK